MAEILSTVSWISFIVSGVCVVLAVIFWFKFGIPGVIGDLSGRKAKKSIAKMRENLDKTGAKHYPPETEPLIEKETELLEYSKKLVKRTDDKKLRILDEVIIVHTDEVIE